MLNALTSLFKKSSPKPLVQQLVLIRHADALPATFNGEDETRELSDKGKLQAEALGSWLATALETDIDAALTSTATRTVQTYLALQSHCSKLPETWQREEELYHGSSEPYQQIIDGAQLSSLLIVGHNPAIGALAAHMVGGDAETQAALMNMPPAACLVFDRQDGVLALKAQRLG